MKLTKTPILVALAAALMITASGLVALAQGPGGPPGGGRGGFGGGGGGRGGGGMRMYENLGLSAAQKAKVEALVKKQRDEQQALRKKHTDQVKALLTPEQRKKLDQQMEEMRQRFSGMMGGGQGGPGGPGGGGARGGGR